MTDARQDVVNWANWAVANRGGFTYTEGPQRMEGIGHPGIPCHADCSAFVTLCYNWAGVSQDPNGQGYDGQGYTGTLLSNGQQIDISQVVPGDVIVYGPGTGDHTALVIQGGSNPLTVSMGQQGDPNYCYVSQDGRQPQRYLRFDTTKPGPPPAPAHTWTGSPSLQVGQRLQQGQMLASPNKQYAAMLQTDGNFVIYNSTNQPLWADGGNNVFGSTFVLLQTDGNLVHYLWNNHPLWSTATQNRGAKFLTMQDDGNLVLYNAQNQALWASNTHH